MAVFYADSSALVKLVQDEPESSALRAFLADADLVSSELIQTEIPRALRRAAGDDPALPLDLLLERAGAVVEAVALRPLDRALLAAAGALSEPALRPLDAIHVASALLYQRGSRRPFLLVTADARQRDAARQLVLTVTWVG